MNFIGFRFKMPADTPAAACANCIWWTQRTVDGWGRCHIYNERRYYKCMVCSEYELDPEAVTTPGQ